MLKLRIVKLHFKEKLSQLARSECFKNVRSKASSGEKGRDLECPNGREEQEAFEALLRLPRDKETP